ncbi:MAG: glycosyltransferase family 39 protein [Elusimicrobia bacterium]|nr:glycosyltransferase family 39 protein [Elusimicrobiota bacterium]
MKLKAALLAALAAFCLRLALWSRLQPFDQAWLRPDSAGYLELAKELRHGRFSAMTPAGLAPEANRTPVYPFFLSLHGPLLEQPRWPALSQIAIDAASAGLIAASAGMLGAPALAAGLIYALDPVVAGHSLLILTETLFTFWLVLSLFALTRGGPEKIPWLAISGLSLGAAALTRPIAAYLWLPWVIALYWAWGRRARRALAIFALCAVALPALWCGRNALVFGRFRLSMISGLNLFYWEAPAVLAASEGISFGEALAKLIADFERTHPSRPSSDPFAESDLRSAFALDVMRSHPARVAQVHAAAAVKLWLGPGLDLVAEQLWPGERLDKIESSAHGVTGRGTLFLMRQRPALRWWLAAIMAWLAGCYLLAALGLRALLRNHGAAFAASWLTPLAYLALLSTGGWCYYRFRVPLWPAIALLAAAGLSAAGLSRRSSAPSDGRRSP